MGFLLRRKVKDANKRYTSYIILDIILIIVFIWFGLTIKSEWQNGFDFCAEQSCPICFAMTNNITINQNNLQNLSFNFSLKNNKVKPFDYP